MDPAFKVAHSDLGPAKLTVAVNAALDLASGSGVEQATATLVRGLSDLDHGDESYVVVTSPLLPDWIGPSVRGSARIVVAPRSLFDPRSLRELRIRGQVRRTARPLLPLFRAVSRRTRRGHAPPALLASSDGFFESLGARVVHFPYQRYLRTSLPSIFEPWDLQHRHLPEFFTADERAWREATYRPACEAAAAVVVSSDWVRADVVRQFQLPARKVYRIRRSSPTALSGEIGEPDLRAVREAWQLPDAFLLCPAQTWPHKNHLRLLEAVARLRDGASLRVPVICCGFQTEHFGVIRRRVAELSLGDQVRFLGYVTGRELRAIYRLARGVVLPSLFEGYGFPLIESFHEGVPVASSNATCLPELAGSAALLFDPASAAAMAEAIGTLWSRPEVRAALVREGRGRLALFDSVEVARTYRALYRSLAGVAIGDDERALLEAARPPLAG